ncbi:hypothetical protein [Streptomyces sp. NRRL S-378]|uniref:hypothetical protein n=1 Tax=Streptomyces sp. NRRL S-378 TaxID=1463904 RepID=UPI0004CC0E9F|nr:hypothetical protein [Streptomyces sp. NRRL S-378]
MPGVDDLDQNIQFPLLSDPPNIESAMSNLVDGVVPRLNLRFADANARAATITSPVAGMECFLIAEKRKEIYDGTAWVTITPGGWVPLSLDSGYAPYSTSNPAYRIVNNSVELRGKIQRSGFVSMVHATAFRLASLPNAIRPASERTFIVATEWAADLFGWLTVQPNGNLTAVLPPTGTAPVAAVARWIALDGVSYPLS